MDDTNESQAPPEARSNSLALVADDFAATRTNLRATIYDFDPSIEVVEAENGQLALAALSKRVPDIAFINLQLPLLTGAEALAISRAEGITPFTILMSNVVMPEWVEVSMQLGAYEFLKKPFDPEHVMHLLRGHRRMQDPIKLLLVDASQTARQLVRRILANSSFSFEIDETDTGNHAIKVMRMATYDVALIDMNLPIGIDGLETACQANEVAPNTTLILMSTSEGGAIEQASRHFGVASLLRKPFYPRDVDHALHAALRLRRPYLLNALVNAAPPPLRQAG
jgi:CheY-like chemotaxis protein